MFIRQEKHRKTTRLRAFANGIEVELFVASVLSVLVALAAIRSFIAPGALAAIGIGAFALMLGIGTLQTARRKQQPSALPLITIAALAIVWIAAGRLHILEL